MVDLPKCVHRHGLAGQNVICGHEKIIETGFLPVSMACESCRWRNAPNVNSRGLGDTLHKFTHATGIQAAVSAIETVTGIDCGCAGRKERLNQRHPYGNDGQGIFEYQVCEAPSNDAASLSGDTVRNLLMYIYPIAQHEVWRWNISQIRQRLQLFNGKRIVTVACDDRTNDAQEVIAEFGNDRIDEWNVIENDPARWEMNGLPRMMDYVYSCDPNEITFYCHAKGVQGPAHVSDPHLHQQPRIKWATAMYGACLDDMPFVETQLEAHTFAGAFKRRMVHGLPPFRSSWHFAGTFYWFRNARLFSLPNWHHFDHQWYGAETYPGQLVGWGQAAGLFCDHPPILYLTEAWEGQVDAMWQQWKQEHGLCTPA